MRAIIDTLRDTITGVIAEIEVGIDFPDEAEESAATEDSVSVLIDRVAAPLARLLERYRTGVCFREGIRLAIIGRPNAGKSTLMNRLVGKERVIVAEIPGTTRDVVEETVDILGVPVTLADTAGLHASTDALETLGMEKTRAHVASCDMVLVVIDATIGIRKAEMDILVGLGDKRCLLVINKTDLVEVMDRFWKTSGVINRGYPSSRFPPATGTGSIGSRRPWAPRCWKTTVPISTDPYRECATKGPWRRPLPLSGEGLLR